MVIYVGLGFLLNHQKKNLDIVGCAFRVCRSAAKIIFYCKSMAGAEGNWMDSRERYYVEEEAIFCFSFAPIDSQLK